MTKTNLRLLEETIDFLSEAKYGDYDHEVAGDLEERLRDLFLAESDLRRVKMKVISDFNRTLEPHE
jgi:hypothetical protein